MTQPKELKEGPIPPHPPLGLRGLNLRQDLLGSHNCAPSCEENHCHIDLFSPFLSHIELDARSAHHWQIPLPKIYCQESVSCSFKTNASSWRSNRTVTNGTAVGQQLTFRALAIGLLVGGMLSFSNTYFGLQSGW